MSSTLWVLASFPVLHPLVLLEHLGRTIGNKDAHIGKTDRLTQGQKWLHTEGLAIPSCLFSRMVMALQSYKDKFTHQRKESRQCLLSGQRKLLSSSERRWCLCMPECGVAKLRASPVIPQAAFLDQHNCKQKLSSEQSFCPWHHVSPGGMRLWNLSKSKMDFKGSKT